MDNPTKIDINSTSVYRETTLPLHVAAKTKKPIFRTGSDGDDKEVNDNVNSEKVKKPQRRDRSDLGENFIAPDGGWAWLVCIAAGISNLVVYPCLQQFGFIFRERLTLLGFSSSHITTIINSNQAVSSCTGLLNGPMFRRFTFRQVGLAGSFFIFIGIMLTAFCDDFIKYMVAYSLLFGFGMGISISASSLAINTYFKVKRRRATGFSWTITGLGPIFLPHLVTALLPIYGVQGTVMLFASISLHSALSALIYQPVQYHAPKPDANTLPECAAANGNDPYQCKYCEMRQKKETGIFSSQYLYQDDDADTPGYEIIEPGTPMLSRANDGWFGSKASLSTMRYRTVSTVSRDFDGGVGGTVGKLNRVISEEELKTDGDFFKPNNFKRERDEVLKNSNSKGNLRLQFRNRRNSSSSQLRCTCSEERVLMELTPVKSSTPNDSHSLNNNNTGTQLSTLEDDIASKLTFLQKVVIFFDLDLLRDFTYVNLVIGLTIINFGELNFSILTPLILNDFGLDTYQITLAMSVLALCDITVRFVIPFVTEKIPWDNRVFFLIGVVGIACGRTVVACTRSFEVILTTFVFIGICKGVRTIFWPLIIPGYIPLKRLPAASGLQLLITGIFSLMAGPFVGMVRDRYDYSVTLHCLDAMSFIAAIAWSAEALVRRYYRNRKKLRVPASDVKT